jgi:hypothetical protein
MIRSILAIVALLWLVGMGGILAFIVGFVPDLPWWWAGLLMPGIVAALIVVWCIDGLWREFDRLDPFA